MKINFSNPAAGTQKQIEIDDERKTRIFMEKRISQEVAIDNLGDEFKGYVVKITGGSDKQGFPMKQGVLQQHRVRLLLPKGASCTRETREGHRRRKSVRGCIVAGDIVVLSVAIVKVGDNDIPGLTDTVLPKRLGPKRATKIRKFFNLSKEDDVRKYVIRREVTSKKKPDAKPYTKAPKIQRLVTPERLQRRRHLRSLARRKTEVQKAQIEEYKAVLAKRLAEKKQRNVATKAKRAAHH